MARGKKAKNSVNARPGPSSSKNERPPKPAAPNAGEQLCAFCHSHRNRSKTTSACWLCGENDWIEKTESDSDGHEETDAKPLCCGDAECWRCFRIADNEEKYCGECGSPLEECSLQLWLDKLVEPALLKSPHLSLPTREHLIDRAVLAGFSRATAATELQRKIERVQGDNLDDANRLKESRSSPVGNADDHGPGPRRQEAAADLHPDSAIKRQQTLVPERRPLSLKITYGALVCVTLVVLLALLGHRMAQTMNNKPDPVPAPTQTPALPKPDQMILIEGGSFIMGRDRSRGGDEFESPAHEVSVESFYIDVFEVTREQYKACVDAGVCGAPFGWQGNSYPPGTAKWPVTGVTWNDANQYARFVNKRLPTEEEWEFAAGHGTNQRYPWGDTWVPQQANIASQTLTDVGSYPAHFGLYDMIGNAQEWTSAEWKQYPEKTTYIRTKENPERLRVIRGSSYQDSSREATVTYRNAVRAWEDRDEESHYEQTGFRCIRDKKP